MTDTVPVRWTYGANGNDITTQPYAELDADEAVAWSGAHGDMVELALVRVGDRWEIDTSDTGVPEGMWDATFASPDAALSGVGEAKGVEYREAVCRCGTADECD